MILDKIIPEPNLVLTSRGIQLFYSIDRGASPELAWLTGYITEQLISKLKHLGADAIASDVSRVMRVPNSINERNNTVVKPKIWNDEAYTLQELQMYCRPLELFETRKRKRMKVIIRKSEPDKRIAQFYKTNYARLSDLRRLIELRKGDFTGMRNVFLYIYSFHQSLVLNTQRDVIWSVRRAFQDVFSKTEGQLSNTEFEKTVKGAYHDAREFFDHYKGNGYIVVFNHT